MLKHYKNLCVLFTVAVMSVLFIGCGDDDDDFSTDKPIDASIKTTDGNLLAVRQVERTKFYYDDSENLVGINSAHYVSWDVLGSELTDNEGTTIRLRLNGNGLITEAVVQVDISEEDGSYEKSDMKVSFSYNSSNQLTGYSCHSSYEEFFADEDWYEIDEGKASLTCTWRDNCLVKAVIQSSGTDKEGESKSKMYDYPWTDTQTMEYEYGTQENVIRQMPRILGGYIIDLEECFEDLSYLGLFGAGPSYFPSRMSDEWKETYVYYEDGKKIQKDEGSKTYTYSMSYSLNSNGTIRTENINGKSFPYYYDERETRAITAEAEVNDLSPIKRHFRSHRHAKRTTNQ